MVHFELRIAPPQEYPSFLYIDVRHVHMLNAGGVVETDRLEARFFALLVAVLAGRRWDAIVF